MRALSLGTFFLLTSAAAWAESVAGLSWTAPAGWKNEGSRPMRAATYNVPAAPGDADPGECVVYFFGEGQGGGVEANLERWKGQLKGPGGKPVESKTAKRKVRNLPVTTIDAVGDYTGMGGPMAASRTVKPGYRLLGAIIEGPGGNVFLKFTGPFKTVAANQAKFEQLLNSFQAK
jgi:hypothetical protein